MRRALSCSALIALSLALQPAALAGPGNNSLVIGASQEPANILDPWVTNNIAIGVEINNLMTASLLYRDNSGTLLPGLATRVPSLGNGDYKLVKNASGDVVRNSVTYTLRPAARWSDGAPITSQDFAFWLKVVQDERVPVPTRLPWKNAKITVQSPRTFTITYDPPYLFADVGTPGLAPAHVMEKGYNAFAAATARLNNKTDADRITESWRRYINAYTTVNSLMKVTSGPFKPSTWRAGSSFTMVRNPNYWRKPEGGESKYLQSITYRFIPNTTTLKVNILSGQLDALSSLGVSLDQALELERNSRVRNNYTVRYVNTGTVEQISPCQAGDRARSLGLTDRRVRQALTYATDRAALSQALFQGKQPPFNTWVNPASPLYKKDVRAYPYDPERARTLLAAAGWKPGPDGILTKGGVRMVLNMTTTAGNAVRERVQQILQEQWRKVGVGLKIQNYPASVVFSSDFGKRCDEGKWDLFMFAWGSDAIGEDGSLFATAQIPTAANGYTGTNYPKYSNPAYDTVWKQSMVEFDRAARIRLFDRLQTIWNEDLPVIPLYSRLDAYTRAVGLVNYDRSGSSTAGWNAYQIGWASRGAVPAK